MHRGIGEDLIHLKDVGHLGDGAPTEEASPSEETAKPEAEKSENPIEEEAAKKDEAAQANPEAAKAESDAEEAKETEAKEAEKAADAANKVDEAVKEDEVPKPEGKQVENPAEQENAAAMQASVQKNLAAVKQAKDAVDTATKTLDKTDMQRAHNATRDAKPDEVPQMAADANETSAEPPLPADEEKSEQDEEATKVADETSKLVKEKMNEAVKEADKEAKKDAEESAKAIIDKAKAKGETKEELTIAKAEDNLKLARDEHSAAVKHLAAAKAKAGMEAVKYKATAKAIEGIKRQEEVAKIPIAEDDMRPRTKLSAVDWAKKLAEERLVAYRDHMEAAHAADREAAASQALLDAEAQVEHLKEELRLDKMKVSELQGIVKEARFDSEEVKARGKFTTRGEVAKLKYEAIDEQNENEVSKEDQKLVSANKELMLSQTALNQLVGGGTLENAQKAEKDALAELASADAQARIATEEMMVTKESADKASKLVIAKQEKKKAEKALKAKKLADDLLAAKKREQTSVNKVGNAVEALKNVKAATEKSEKSAVAAKIASEKAQKAKENDSKMQKMKANEGDAKSVEKKKKANEKSAKKQEKDEQMKEKTAKNMQKSEIEAKTTASEKTSKAAAKEANQKADALKASAEKATKKDSEKDKEASEKAALESQKEADKANERATKLKAKDASGSPCETCMSKCATRTCRTWCNAHWCEGTKASSSGKKEIYQKLKVAKADQKEAAEAMQSSK